MRVPPGPLLLALLALGIAPPAGAEDAPPAPDPETAEAERAFDQGRYGDAEAMWRRAASKEGEAGAAARAGLARVLAETGRLREALESARKAVEAGPRDTGRLVLLGEIQAAAGDLEGAEKTLRDAAAGSGSSAVPRTALGDLLRARGRRKEALEAYDAANGLWAEGGAEEPAERVAVVRARFGIMDLDPDPGYRSQMQSTFDILAEPLRRGLPEAVVLRAELYTRHDQTERVKNALQPLLSRNPSHPGALVALARARVRRFESDEAGELARQALAVDPSHPGAIGILALLRYGDGDRAGAEALVHRGLEARPRDRVLLALDAVRPYLGGDQEGFEAGVRKALAVDPTFGRAFDFAARVLEDQRRFAEAAAMARRAVEVDPGDPDAWFSLARNLLNLGHEKEARKALARAAKADPWRNIFRENFATVLAELDEYSSGSTRNFQLRIHAAEDAALRPLYERSLERSFEDLRKRYGFDPQTPVLVEVFRRAETFSARTLGVPGFGAVGACFGRLVTLDSPSALPAGAFSWRSTLHHELAHVYHLQMTKGRVPRWFTEGLSVHEEKVARPAWVRNMDRDLVSAMANGTVRGLRSIDAAFRGDVMWAYYQSGLMCDWLETAFGWPKVLEMLRLYGQDLDNEAVVRRALGLSPEEFDAKFLDYCRGLTAGWSLRPRWSPEKVAEFRGRSEKERSDLEAHLLLGEACLQAGKSIDAGTALARAQAAAPEDPFLLELRGWLAIRALKTPDRGIALLREALAKGRDHFELRMYLGREADGKGRDEEALEHYRRAKVLFPRAAGDADPRKDIARIYIGLGDAAAAARETAESVSMNETDLAGRLVLADYFEGAGDLEAAVRVLRECVDIMPVPGKSGRPFPAADVHARLGRDLAKMQRPAEGADSLRLAVVVGRTCDPRADGSTIAAWLVDLAKAARAAGRSLEAKAALEDALRTDPENAEAADLLRSPGDG